MVLNPHPSFHAHGHPRWRGPPTAEGAHSPHVCRSGYYKHGFSGHPNAIRMTNRSFEDTVSDQLVSTPRAYRAIDPSLGIDEGGDELVRWPRVRTCCAHRNMQALSTRVRPPSFVPMRAMRPVHQVLGIRCRSSTR
jgi:hypothetical protein